MSTSTVSEADGGRFYLLKKDSERRRTLEHVLRSDSHAIVDVWFKELEKSIPDLSLNMAHLTTLLQGLRDFIPENDRSSLMNSIYSIKEDFEFESTAGGQLQSALLCVQYAISTILKRHSIKPHWMFALDNLIRSAVQAAITILSPELGQNLAGDSKDNETSVDSPASSVDTPTPHPLTSNKSMLARTYDRISFHHESSPDREEENKLRDSYKRVKAENMKLWSELLDAEQSIQSLLKSSLEAARFQIRSLESRQVNGGGVIPSSSSSSPPAVFLAPQPPPRIIVNENPHANSNGNNHHSHNQYHHPSLQQHETSSNMTTRNMTNNTTTTMMDLRSWLEGLSLDPDSIAMMVNNFSTVIELLTRIQTRDDLKRFNLRISSEQRIWREMLRLRHRRSLSASSEASSNNSDFGLPPSPSSSSYHPLRN